MEDKILLAREKRIENIKYLNFKITILIKANVPGNDKNIWEAFFLIKLFKQEVQSKVNIKSEHFFESADGPYYLLEVKEDKKLKDTLIDIETYHPLGRLIDLDLFINNDLNVFKSISRKTPRKCMLCSDNAFNCIRSQKHKTTDILKHIHYKIHEYNKNAIYSSLTYAVTSELNLENKFGLVTPTSNGSHKDMNYSMMMESFKVIVEDFISMYDIGFTHDDLDYVFTVGKMSGRLAEHKMLDVTNNINTYKGLIYILGVICLSVGYAMKHFQNEDGIFDNIKKMTNGFLGTEKYDTFGEYAKARLNFPGAREETKNGLPAVRQGLQTLRNYPVLKDEGIMMTLIEIIRYTSDTVLLKRAGSYERYEYFKNLIGNIKEYDIDKIKKVTEECIASNISCGGAADLLIATLFINDISQKYQFLKVGF